MAKPEDFINIYYKSFQIKDINIKNAPLVSLNKVTKNLENNRAVFSVLLTLAMYKLCYPQQDIRLHQHKLNGFSGRMFDSKYITPILKKLGLPCMKETGWMSRSLEQPAPYNSTYPGRIRGVKKEFLDSVDFIQSNPDKCLNVIRYLLNKAIKVSRKREDNIIKLINPDIGIKPIINILNAHFIYNYKTTCGSKLPVLASYAMFIVMMKEFKKYNGCELKPLRSHFSSDTSSNAAGDLEIFKKDKLFEVMEVKAKQINADIINDIIGMVKKYRPQYYLICSTKSIDKNEKMIIEETMKKAKKDYGCEIIIYGNLLKYIQDKLFLISRPADFFNEYVTLVSNDLELKIIHKKKLAELIANAK